MKKFIILKLGDQYYLYEGTSEGGSHVAHSRSVQAVVNIATSFGKVHLEVRT